MYGYVLQYFIQYFDLRSHNLLLRVIFYQYWFLTYHAFPTGVFLYQLPYSNLFQTSSTGIILTDQTSSLRMCSVIITSKLAC